MAMLQKAWYDRCFVSIAALNGGEVALQSRTTNLNISGGNFDIEGIETFGGKVVRVGTKDDIEISMEGLPVSHTEFDWILAGQTSATQSAWGTGGAAITSSQNDRQYRVTFLWTNQTSPTVTSATQVITGSAEARRRSYAGAYCVSLEESQDAGDVSKATIKFKLASEDDSGVNNWGVWSKDTTSGTLSALNAYTSNTTKW